MSTSPRRRYRTSRPGPDDFRRVAATAEEKDAYVAKHRRRPTQYRVQCKLCDTRIWGSGLGAARCCAGCS